MMQQRPPMSLCGTKTASTHRWCARALFWGLVAMASWLALAPAPQVPEVLRWWDKAQHTAGFAALAFWGLVAYPRGLSRLVPGLVLFGVGIEIAQAFTGWRHGDWRDWAADCVGIALGWAAWRCLLWWWGWRSRSRPTFHA
ncbi:VanZ family protein [Candidatus Symbiobacter mobilis]|uniref:VanZ-like protein n=1 Tax=Candidatus Symbiobacter mobilis CR TaxID=946483 RepID=U5N8F4_9BURK|nr:VanZ family protein [Candidatus Symbiobacter mobilis]AGX87687.1 VanZ-like protein [Candidatus Symbiobacter mobilis CR]